MRRQRPYCRSESPARLMARRILIVCEGETEENYFYDFRRERGLSAVQVVRAGVPLTVVEKAVELKKREAAGDPYYSVWCVFDRDDHPNIAQALRLARDNKLKVAFSLPSFELWYILHVRDQTAHIERDKAEKLCRKCFPGWQKPGSLYDKLRDSEPAARRRAITLREKHRLDGSREHTNPSTGCDGLVDLLRAEILRHERKLGTPHRK